MTADEMARRKAAEAEAIKWFDDNPYSYIGEGLGSVLLKESRTHWADGAMWGMEWQAARYTRLLEAARVLVADAVALVDHGNIARVRAALAELDGGGPA